MNDFMLPPQAGVVGELPPGLPPAAPVAQVPQQPVAMQAPVAPAQAPAPAGDFQQIMLDEGATADTPHGMGFFDKIRSDPKMTQAMLMMGTRMMQGNKPGQDDMGMIGEAMMAGATAHNMLSYNEQQNAIKKQELDMRQRESTARVGQLEQETKQKAELFPNTKRKLELDLQNAQTDGDKKKAELAIKEFEADPARMAKKEGLDNARIQAQTNASNASAGASSAAAESSRATTSDKKKSAQMKEWAVSGTDEQKKQARDYFTVDDPTARSASSTQDANMKLIKMANPDWTEQQVAKEALVMTSTAKANYMATAQKIAENADGSYTPEQVQTAKDYVVGQVTAQAGRAQGAAPAKAPAAAKVIPEADIASNMKKYRKTREEVIAAAKAQGYTVGSK